MVERKSENKCYIYSSIQDGKNRQTINVVASANFKGKITSSSPRATGLFSKDGAKSLRVTFKPEEGISIIKNTNSASKIGSLDYLEGPRVTFEYYKSDGKAFNVAEIGRAHV